MAELLKGIEIEKLDAFPKLPKSYKARSEGRGIFTVLVLCLVAFFLAGDLGEFLFGYPDFEFSVDSGQDPNFNVNVDMTVAMPCAYLTVDLRDAVGDRLYLSSGLRRDGTVFDTSHATKLKEHAKALSASQAYTQARKSRRSRGWFDAWKYLFSSAPPKPIPAPQVKRNAADHGRGHAAPAENTACRIWGQLVVKKVTANLHITVLGHGYTSYEYVDTNKMNLSHVINEFSFGPFFPEIAQPLDNSYELTHEKSVAYQYFMHVVPTQYYAPRSAALDTNQYSVTHYERQLDERGVPGIFFKYEIDPLAIRIHQRTTTFVQFFIRVIGVFGGVFVCASWSLRIGTKAMEVVVGKDDSDALGPASAGEASGFKLRTKWGGGDLRTRGPKMVRQGSGWVLDSSTPNSPALFSGPTTGGWTGSGASTPVVGTGVYPPPSPFIGSAATTPAFPPPSPFIGSASATAGGANSAFPPPSPFIGGGTPATFPPPAPGSARSPAIGPPRTPHTGARGHLRTSSLATSPIITPNGEYERASGYSVFPPTPNPAFGGGFPMGPPPTGSNGNSHGSTPPPPPKKGKDD